MSNTYLTVIDRAGAQEEAVAEVKAALRQDPKRWAHGATHSTDEWCRLLGLKTIEERCALPAFRIVDGGWNA